MVRFRYGVPPPKNQPLVSSAKGLLDVPAYQIDAQDTVGVAYSSASPRGQTTQWRLSSAQRVWQDWAISLLCLAWDSCRVASPASQHAGSGERCHAPSIGPAVS